MTLSEEGRIVFDRIARVIAGVVHEALLTTRAEAVVLLDAESAEGTFLARILTAGDIPVAEYTDATATLTAHPANKTALLVGDFIPRVDLLPLGDLYASQIEAFTGEWSGDEETHHLAAAAGGIRKLDGFLEYYIDQRSIAVASDLFMEPVVCDGIIAAIRRTRFRRARTGLVPKLGARTIGVDLLD